MTPLAAVLTLVLAAVTGERSAVVVQAPSPPVRIDRATVVTVPDAPPVLVYSATNLTDDELDQFTVIAFVFDVQGTLKATQVAPGRRTLEKRGTKYLRHGARRVADCAHRLDRGRRESGTTRRVRRLVAGRPSGGGPRRRGAHAIACPAQRGRTRRTTSWWRRRHQDASAPRLRWVSRQASPGRRRAGPGFVPRRLPRSDYPSRPSSVRDADRAACGGRALPIPRR